MATHYISETNNTTKLTLFNLSQTPPKTHQINQVIRGGTDSTLVVDVCGGVIPKKTAPHVTQPPPLNKHTTNSYLK